MTMLDIVPHTRELEIIQHTDSGYFSIRIYEYGQCIFERSPFLDYDTGFLIGIALLNKMHQLCPLIEEGGIDETL